MNGNHIQIIYCYYYEYRVVTIKVEEHRARATKSIRASETELHEHCLMNDVNV